MNYRARSGELKRIFKIWRIGLSQRGESNGVGGDGTCLSIPRRAAPYIKSQSTEGKQMSSTFTVVLAALISAAPQSGPSPLCLHELPT